MKSVLFCSLFLVLSLFSTTASSGCSKHVRRNGGPLAFPEGAPCTTFTWLFDVRAASTLVIDMPASTNSDAIMVKQRSSRDKPFRVLERSASSRRLRFSSPTRQVELTVPSSRTIFEAQFRMLRRAPSLSPSMEQCRVRSPGVLIHCDGGLCAFTCSSPGYIPTNKSLESVECRSNEWRYRVDHLCMPRENLRNLCFGDEGETIKCEFTVDDINKFFNFEELDAENGVPPLRKPRLLGVSSFRSRSKSKRARFRDYVCKRTANHKYRFKCGTLKRRVMNKCIYWRYLTSYCDEGAVFT